MLSVPVLLLATLATTATSCAHSSWTTQICLGPPQVWEARPSPGKGTGVYATRALEAGDTILSESAVLHVTPPEFRDGVASPLSDVHALLQSSFDALSEEAQAEVMALHAYMAPNEGSDDRLMSILRSNAYNTGGSLGLFPKGARINHSCQPNTSQFWDTQLRRRVVYANRHIEEGEEVFATYIPLLYSHEARQARLDQYGFKCTCAACALKDDAKQASDERRKELRNAFAAFESQVTLAVPQSLEGKKKARKNAEASIQLVESLAEEGLADYYVRAYHIAAVAHGRIEAWESATLWANKGFETSLLADPDARLPDTRELHTLTSHFIDKWDEELRINAMRHN